MQILVVGPTSFLARPLVEELLEHNHTVRILTRDPRLLPAHWQGRVEGFWGSVQDNHILHSALDGCERVVSGLFHGVHPKFAVAAELETTRILMNAIERHGNIPMIRLTTAGNLRMAEWWAMSVRRRADILVDQAETPTCLAEIGWVAEMLAPLVRNKTLWLPHPRSCPHAMMWQSLHEATRKLTQLVERLDLPKRQLIQGNDSATVDDLSIRLCIRHPQLRRIFVPGRFFQWFAPANRAMAYMGQRLIHGASNDSLQRISREQPRDAFVRFRPLGD